MKILQIANYAEGAGGISVQVRLLRDHWIAEGVGCDVLSTKGTPLKRLSAVMKLLFLGKEYDVFHIHACSDRGFFPAVTGVTIGRLLKKRMVLTYHGGGAEAFFRRHPRLVRHYLTRTDANIVLSGFSGKIFEMFSIPCTVIPNIVALKEGVFREREEMAPRFISIRSFHDIYNVECTLRAFQRVQDLYPDASLLLLGDGPLREELETFVKDREMTHVTFVGQVGNDEIYRYLARCDIMVSSSRIDNMPVSVLEGFNAGLLVIASNVGGVPYMIQDGVNGFLFESDDDRGLAQKMVFALEHPAEVRQMVNEARQALGQYSWEHCRPQLMRLYRGE
jgi:glycosyltransferase involved in cell wall biosynthesis